MYKRQGAIRKHPYQVYLGNAAGKDRRHPDDAVRRDQPDAPQVLQGFCPKVGPAQEGGDYKGDQADRQERRAHIRNFTECQRSEPGAVTGRNIRVTKKWCLLLKA